ncbi:MAG: hypothetical protein GWO20_10480, partial [Candidatus Korarchaeota archaeon]|nr:hypothetical protein [Candidatus Korarchaeota archaeon]NIU82172.1 hypothetical protein [Candidatus Thorarchaeota archaeon]NIW14054.1 hypothetical protein [Candidatus Thorarchaeota archaeon]NIW52157.1 hypothetical protein [Candidatus Korarchaeota archaeon]
KHHGYTRESIWIFSHDENVYDSAGEELVSDYLGVGPAAFSKIKNLQTVNPTLEIYLDMLDNES